MPASEFDPYFKWLGIPREYQPADHYRLLGIPQFLDDAEVIQHAADQRMMLVKSFQSGLHSDWSQRLLLELAKAKRCLLTPEAKTVYDAALRKTMTADANAKLPPTAAPPRVGPEPPPPHTPPATRSTPLPGFEPPPHSAPPEPPDTRRELGAGQVPLPDQPARDFTEPAPTDELSVSSLFGRAMQTGREIKAKALSAARHTGLLAEKRKIESIDLPQAFASLGRDIVNGGRFRDQLADHYRRVQRLAAQWRNAESHDDEDDGQPHSFAEIAASVAERFKDVVSTPGILSNLNAAYAELGAAAFAAFGEKSGPPGLVAQVVMHRCRLDELERELAADS